MEFEGVGGRGDGVEGVRGGEDGAGYGFDMLEGVSSVSKDVRMSIQ